MTITIKPNNDGSASIQKDSLDRIIINADGSTSVSSLNTGGLNGGPLAGFRNRIINGNFDFWQRGTSMTFTGTGSAGNYLADRWYAAVFGASGTASIAVAQQPFTIGQTEVPNEPKYYMAVQPTVMPTLGASGGCVRIMQAMESVRTYAGKTVTVSFWAKADTTRTYAVMLDQYFGTGGSPSARFGVGQTINVTASWKYFTVTINVPSIAGKTIGTNGDDFLGLEFILYKQDNTIFNDNLGPVGTFTANMYLALSQVQVEQGTIATPFENRPIAMELAMCQRYYEVLTGTRYVGVPPSGGTQYATWTFKVTKRIAPTVIASNSSYAAVDSTGVDGFSVYNTNSNNAVIGVGTSANSDY